MARRTRWICALWLGLSACLAGCEQAGEQLSRLWNKGDADAVESDLIALEAEPNESPSGSLDFNLQTGDRFPLLKTVEQTLTQQTPTGPAVGRSTLELLLAIEVEEIREDGKRLGVRYHRVRYQQDIAGEHLVYDSESPPETLPPELQVYAGLLDNGFSFWIGPDNQIRELVGFNDFLNRCVRLVPPAQRQAVVTRLAETSGEEGIANFIDESIGLLPPGSGATDAAVTVGDTWTREREVARPIPLYVSHNCTLKQLSDATAEIEIAGAISTSTTYGPATGVQSDPRVTVRGGHIVGNCTIDRRSGLPVQSRTERNLDMSVQLADGTSFEQQKRIVTKIRAFPEVGSVSAQPEMMADTQPSNSGVVPASHTELAPHADHRTQ